MIFSKYNNFLKQTTCFRSNSKHNKAASSVLKHWLMSDTGTNVWWDNLNYELILFLY